MRSSNIGGQAVIEGVMMKNKDTYAVAVRKPDNEISVEIFNEERETNSFEKLPIIRGVVELIKSLTIGMKIITYSASFYDDEEDKDKNKKGSDILSIVISVILALIIFVLAPYYVSRFINRFVGNELLTSLIEGIVRLIFFVGYVAVISLAKDIKRVYMYHGAEHKCINCIEHGMELNVDNVRKSSRFHKRCGTSFILIVVLISIIIFCIIRVSSPLLRLALRIVMIPVIAGISYECIKIAGKHDNVFVKIISAPGLWLQRITTREPDDSMIEVGIASVEAVFDWKAFLKEDGE